MIDPFTAAIIGALIACVAFSAGRATARDENEHMMMKRIIRRRVDKRVAELYKNAGTDVDVEISKFVSSLVPQEEVDPRD